jgi:flagellar hook-associated protein 2
MADPISSISGLASGVQWRDLVEQIMDAETARKLTPVKDKATAQQKTSDAWASFAGLVTKFRDSLAGLRDGTAFGAFKVDVGNSPTTSRSLLSASGSPSATPGAYQVEVLDLARANKLSGDVVASASAALGLTGDFSVNGKQVSVLATDSLSKIRDKINALNTGTSPSGVSATILTTGASSNRLVLTSASTGATGIELVDGASGTLASLGVVDSAKTINLSATGGSQTFHVSAATAAIATMMGVTMPPPSTITVGGQTISVDLAIDSLTTIANKIQALGVNATVESETVNGKTSYKLVTDGTVGASTVDGQRTLEVLGFVKNTRSAVSQVVATDNQFVDAGAATATGATLLSDLSANGAGLGLAAGDTFVIQGKRGDGTIVSTSFVLNGGETLQDVVNALNAGSGFGGGARSATASVVNGKIVLTDAQGGDSQLSLSMSVTKAGGAGTVGLGRVSATTVGRLREVVAGSDAQVRVEGVFMARSTNAITDAITGVTLNLQQAEPGSTVSVAVGRDADGVAKTFSDIATAYNNVIAFVKTSSADKGPLENSPTLRASMQQIRAELLATVPGASTGLSRAGLAGLALTKDGTLSVDNAVLTPALNTNFGDLVKHFQSSGTATNADVSYVTSGDRTRPGTYAINVASAATQPTLAGAGFSGTYADDGVDDTMTVSDALTGASGSITLANGDDTDTIVNKLNAMFTQKKMAVTASKNGNDITLTGSEYGLASKFTIAYTAGGTGGTAQLGLAAGTYTGADIVGTIDGQAATGAGRVLTAGVGTFAEGLSIKYTGTATGAIGTMDFVLGAGGAIYRAAAQVGRPGGGAAATEQDGVQKTIKGLNLRADTIQSNLDRRRKALIAQFSAMEAAMSRIQSQGTAITNFLTAVQAQARSN